MMRDRFSNGPILLTGAWGLRREIAFPAGGASRPFPAARIAS
jgi:hypothetical protein